MAAGAGPVYQGNLDGVGSEVATGWAWNWYQPYGSVTVDLYDGAIIKATATANQYSAALASLESSTTTFGNANHAYSIAIPHSFVDGQNHTLTVKYGGTSMVISNGVQIFNRTPNYQGNHDTTDCFTVSGWVWDSVQPNTPITADIYDGPTLIGSILANQFRQDLLNHVPPIGNGAHGFIFTLPQSVVNGGAHTIYVRYGGTQIATSNSPKPIACSLSFYPITPCRVYDSRSTGYRHAANETRYVQLGGFCGVPASALAVALSTAIVQPTGIGSANAELRLFPRGGATPTALTGTAPNLATVAGNAQIGLGINQQLGLYTPMPAGGTCDVLLDVFGYFK